MSQEQSDLELHGYTQCAECGDLLLKEEARVHVYYKEGQQTEEHFCPDKVQPELSCHDKWYIKHLQKAGL